MQAKRQDIGNSEMVRPCKPKELLPMASSYSALDLNKIQIRFRAAKPQNRVCVSLILSYTKATMDSQEKLSVKQNYMVKKNFSKNAVLAGLIKQNRVLEKYFSRTVDIHENMFYHWIR